MLGIIALLPSLKCAFISCVLFDTPKERTNYERVITVIVLLTSFNVSFKNLLKNGNVCQCSYFSLATKLRKFF